MIFHNELVNLTLHTQGDVSAEYDVKYISGKWLLRVIQNGAVIKSIHLPELEVEGNGFYTIQVVDGEQVITQGSGSDLLIKDLLASSGGDVQPDLSQSYEPSLLPGMEQSGSPLPLENGSLNGLSEDSEAEDECGKLQEHLDKQDHTEKKTNPQKV